LQDCVEGLCCGTLEVMTRRGLLSLPGWALLAQEQINFAPLLDRLSEEAEVFFANITRVVGTETMRAKSIKAQRRFRPRMGTAAPEPPEWLNKEVISEFGVSLFTEGGGILHEVRKVQQVDGRQVLKASDARMSLALDMRSNEDQVRRKLLLDLKQHGLTDVATDFSLSLIMFRKQAARRLEFGPATKARLGADEALVVRFAERASTGEFTVFHGNRTFKQKLQGEVWLRLPDGVPLRVVLVAASPGDKGITILDEGRTDYFASAQGFLLPISVVHRRYANRQLFAETVFSYQRFQRFSAGTEIRFEEVETAPAKP
jgi:hypothetical protein